MRKRSMNPDVIAKGQTALAKWRKEKALAEKKGGEYLKQWQAEQDIKKAQKKTTPMMAIKNFCIDCVATRADITNCTATKCALWIYRPYQKGDDE